MVEGGRALDVPVEAPEGTMARCRPSLGHDINLDGGVTARVVDVASVNLRDRHLGVSFLFSIMNGSLGWLNSLADGLVGK